MTKIVMDLPFPPSTNELWRSNRGRVHLSSVYRSWKMAAGMEWLSQKPKQPKNIPGNFRAILVLDQNQRGQKDCDNRAKSVLDFCKAHQIIDDDKYCDAILIKWGMAKSGAKLTLFSQKLSAKQ